MNNITFKYSVEKEMIKIGDIIKISVGNTSDFYIVAAVSIGNKLGVTLISLSDGTCWGDVVYFEQNRFDDVTMCYIEEKLLDNNNIKIEKFRGLNIILSHKEAE